MKYLKNKLVNAMKLNNLCRLTVVATALIATIAGAQSIKSEAPLLSPAEKLQQVGTFSARTPIGVDLAKKPVGAQLAKPAKLTTKQPEKRRVFQSRQRAVVRPK